MNAPAVTARLYSKTDFSGRSLDVSCASSDRYSEVSHTMLSQRLLDSIGSVELTSSTADANLICFYGADYDRGFHQISLAKEEKRASFSFKDRPAFGSALLIPSNDDDIDEYRLSFSDRFKRTWIDLVDEMTVGTPMRRGRSPDLVGLWFPTCPPYHKALSPKDTYLLIDQQIKVDVPGLSTPWMAAIRYFIRPEISPQKHLRASVVAHECWAESANAVEHDKIVNEMEPIASKISARLDRLLVQSFAQTDLLGAVARFFCLPARQLDPIGTKSVTGSPGISDVTIVLQVVKRKNPVEISSALSKNASITVSQIPGLWIQNFTVLSSGSTQVRGTWLFDLEAGVETNSRAAADLWWEQVDKTKRLLVPQNGATIANLGRREFAAVSRDQLRAASYSTSPIDGSDNARNQLTPGTVIAIKTGRGNWAKVGIRTYGYNLGIEWVTYRAS